MHSKSKTVLGGLLLVIFAELTMAVNAHAMWVQQLDAAVARTLAGSETPINTSLFKIIAILGSPVVAIGLTGLFCVYLWLRGETWLSLWFGGVQLSGSALAEVCKQLVYRQRPLHQLVADTGASFPSGHTFCTAILVLAVLTWGLPRIKDQEWQVVALLLGCLWVLLVALSRVYLRDHFATDVIASMLLASGYWLALAPQRAAIWAAARRIIPERMQIVWKRKN